MDILVLDRTLKVIKIIDDYISLVWTERYAGPGDFSLEIHASNLGRYALRPGYFLYRKDTPTIMEINYVRLKTDTESTIVVKGYSLEAYLARRVMIGSIQFDATTVETAVRQIIQQNITAPEDEARYAPLTIGEFPADAEYRTFSGQFLGETVADALAEICASLGYGYRMRRNVETGRYTFQLYKGEDRSWKQSKNPWVVYSPKLDTLLSSEFVYNDEGYATSFVICGEAESQTINPTSGQIFNWPQVWAVTEDADHSGWDRIEAFVDGSGISRWQGDYLLGTFDPKPPQDVTHGWKKLNESFYKRLLISKVTADYELAKPTLEFEAVGDHNVQWKLGEDVFLGDIVQVVNEYGVSARCRITEITLSHDRNGTKYYPTFEAIDKSIETGDIEWPNPLERARSVIECTTKKDK